MPNSDSVRSSIPAANSLILQMRLKNKTSAVERYLIKFRTNPQKVNVEDYNNFLPAAPGFKSLRVLSANFLRSEIYCYRVNINRLSADPGYLLDSAVRG